MACYLALIYYYLNATLLVDAAIIQGRNKIGNNNNNNNYNNMNANNQNFPGNSQFDYSSNNFEGEENFHDEQVLISRLLWNYDPAARPVFNASKPVIIKFSFALIQLCDMVSYIYNENYFLFKSNV